MSATEIEPVARSFDTDSLGVFLDEITRLWVPDRTGGIGIPSIESTRASIRRLRIELETVSSYCGSSSILPMDKAISIRNAIKSSTTVITDFEALRETLGQLGAYIQRSTSDTAENVKKSHQEKLQEEFEALAVGFPDCTCHLDNGSYDGPSLRIDIPEITLTEGTTPSSELTFTFVPLVLKLYFSERATVRRIMANPHHGEVPANKLSESSHFHPHINVDGTICLGGHEAEINEMMQKCNLFMLIDTVITLLRTYNSSSPYAPLDKFIYRHCRSCNERVATETLRKCTKCERQSCEECLTQNPDNGEEWLCKNERFVLTCEHIKHSWEAITCPSCERNYCSACEDNWRRHLCDNEGCRGCILTCQHCDAQFIQGYGGERCRGCNQCHCDTHWSGANDQFCFRCEEF